MIFVETKRKADDLTRGMRRDGWPALCIHGDKNQSERDWVLSGMFIESLKLYKLSNIFLEFREGKTPILLATDVAARGLGKFVIETYWSTYVFLKYIIVDKIFQMLFFFINNAIIVNE